MQSNNVDREGPPLAVSDQGRELVESRGVEPTYVGPLGRAVAGFLANSPTHGSAGVSSWNGCSLFTPPAADSGAEGRQRFGMAKWVNRRLPESGNELQNVGMKKHDDMPPTPPTGLALAEEVATALRASTRTVRQWLRDGRLPATRIGRRWLIDWRDVNQMLTSQVQGVRA